MDKKTKAKKIIKEKEEILAESEILIDYFNRKSLSGEAGYQEIVSDEKKKVKKLKDYIKFLKEIIK